MHQGDVLVKRSLRGRIQGIQDNYITTHPSRPVCKLVLTRQVFQKWDSLADPGRYFISPRQILMSSEALIIVTDGCGVLFAVASGEEEPQSSSETHFKS